MFRLFLTLSFVFILGTFAISKNQSVNGNFLSVNVKAYRPLWMNTCSLIFMLNPASLLLKIVRYTV